MSRRIKIFLIGLLILVATDLVALGIQHFFGWDWHDASRYLLICVIYYLLEDLIPEERCDFCRDRPHIRHKRKGYHTWSESI